MTRYIALTRVPVFMAPAHATRNAVADARHCPDSLGLFTDALMRLRRPTLIKDLGLSKFHTSPNQPAPRLGGRSEASLLRFRQTAESPERDSTAGASAADCSQFAAFAAHTPVTSPAACFLQATGW
jgi:hypothetical protein